VRRDVTDESDISVDVRAGETIVTPRGHLHGTAAAQLKDIARVCGRPTGCLVLAMSEVTGHDRCVVDALRDIVGEAIEGGYGIELRSTPAGLRADIEAVALPGEMPFT
jgi:hypothetical protein